MTVYWIAELPDHSGSNGSHTRIAIDGASNVHLLYVDETTTSLMHAIGTPRPLFVAPGARGAAVYGGYRWTVEDLEDASYSDPNYYWSDPNLNDLAIDSKGRLHLCLFNQSQLSHAIWDDSAGQFVLTAVELSLGSLWGLAMAIGKDDSVHLAYALDPDAHGKATLKYATRAKDSDPFQLMPIDNRYGWFSNLSIANSGGKTGVSYINGVWANSSMNPNASDSFVLVYAEKTSAGWTTELADPGPMASGLPPNVFGAYYADRGTNSLILDTNGAPHIAYFSDGLGIRHGTRAPTPGSPWVGDPQGHRGERVDAAGQASPASILLDQSGVLHIVYQAQGPIGMELRLATRAGSGPWLTGTVDAGLNSGFAVSAAMASNGQPHIAYGYIPFVNGWLKLKHTFSVNLTLVPFPHKQPKRPIPRRPGT